jgi:hypothetical protein
MTKVEIASIIMERFRMSNSRPNHTIDQRWLRFNLTDKLNPKEQELVNSAITDLVAYGKIAIDNRNGLCLVLTQQGFEEIYPIADDSTKEKIRNMILTGFAKLNSKPNQILDSRWINFNLRSKLNLREMDLLEIWIDDMEKDGFITIEDRQGFCLVLTEKGFNEIY